MGKINDEQEIERAKLDLGIENPAFLVSEVYHEPILGKSVIRRIPLGVYGKMSTARQAILDLIEDWSMDGEMRNRTPQYEVSVIENHLDEIKTR